MARKSKLIFDGQSYVVERGEIVGALPDPYWCDTYNKGKGKALNWAIRFETQEKIVNDECLSPNVEFDGLEFLTISNWHDLLGTSISWTKPINRKTGERYGMTYVFDHQLITKGKLEITHRKGTQFRVVASGQNEEGQRFEVDAEAQFIGVYIRGSGRDSDESIKARVSAHLTLDNLKPVPLEFGHKYDSGVKMGTAFYTPAE